MGGEGGRGCDSSTVKEWRQRKRKAEKERDRDRKQIIADVHPLLAAHERQDSRLTKGSANKGQCLTVVIQTQQTAAVVES